MPISRSRWLGCPLRKKREHQLWEHQIVERLSEQTLRDDVHTNPRHVWPLPGPPGRAPMHLFIAAKSIWKFCDHMSAVTVSYFFFLLAPPASTAKNIGMNSDMVQLKASCQGPRTGKPAKVSMLGSERSETTRGSKAKAALCATVW